MPAPPSLLALRPVAAVHHLPRESEACPLSLRDLLGALEGANAPLPIVVAPLVAIARGALVAAREADAVVGLSAPGAPPEAWFEAVVQAAHELAPRQPFFVSAVVRVEEGEDGGARAMAEAHRLVEAGVTHLAVDVTGLPLVRRAQAAAQTASFAAEREVAVDCLLPSEEVHALVPAEAAAFLEEFEGWGVRADLVSVRLPAAHGEAAEAQLAALAALGRELGDRPVVRRGPLTPELSARLRASPLLACEDGGLALSACLRALPPELAEAARESRRGLLPLPEPLAERLEALAYGEVASLIESAGAGRGAGRVRSRLTPARGR